MSNFEVWGDETYLPLGAFIAFAALLVLPVAVFVFRRQLPQSGGRRWVLVAAAAVAAFLAFFVGIGWIRYGH